MANLHTHF
jgi:hypothetical protein